MNVQDLRTFWKFFIEDTHEVYKNPVLRELKKAVVFDNHFSYYMCITKKEKEDLISRGFTVEGDDEEYLNNDKIAQHISGWAD